MSNLMRKVHHRRTFVNILFLEREAKTLSMLNSAEILLDLVILGMALKAVDTLI